MSKIQLPESFVNRMKKQLPETEWEAFFAVYENSVFYKGIRANALKCDGVAFEKISPFAL